uniref:glucagon-2-like n=1 Tax=Semicossyphus pulcher TaxID=241346 RepID=UPI0037E92AE7
MSGWDICSLYKVSQIIGPCCVVYFQCVFQLHQYYTACARRTITALHWTRVEVPKGDLRMSLHLCCLLLLFLCSSSREMVVIKTKPTSWHLYQMEKGQNIIRNLKRHSDGTFTSDFTHYLDKIKAKDFVEWLARTKQEGCHEDLVQMAAEV